MSRPDPEILSPQNERVKALVRLRDDRAERAATGVMLLEEIRVIRRALAAGHPVREAWFCPELLADDDAAAALAADLRAAGAATVTASARVMEKLAYRRRPAALLAVADLPAADLESLHRRLPPEPLLLVLHDVEKPGNLGAVLRTASGAGAHGVLVAGGADLGNPNTLRASTGAVFSVPCAAAAPDEALAWLRARQLRLVAATPDASLLHHHADLRGGAALILGAEDTGLPAAWLDAADVRVRIPMHGAADSLNVSVAAAVLAYEAERQRSGQR